MSTSASTTPLKIACAIITGPMRRSRYAAAPSATPTPDRIATNPMLPVPRTGSTWANPNSTACSAIVTTTPRWARRPRMTTPRNTISSTTGAATTAVTSSATT